MTILPPQKLTRAEKLARHDKTGKNNIEETADYYIGTCNWQTQTNELLNLHKAVEGFLVDDYKTVQNPFNIGKGDDAPLKYNAQLKNFNILKGIVNLLMGEFGRRVHEYVVDSINPSDEFAFKDAWGFALKDYYAQGVANELAKLGVNTGQPIKELPPLEEYEAKFKNTFEEQRIISGQEVLDYIVYNCDLESKFLDLYYDWIVSGRCFTYKTVNHDDVVYEPVPHYEMFIPREKHSRFVEDYSYVVRRQILPVFKVVDFFKGRMDDDLIDALDKQLTSGLAINFSSVQLTGRNGGIVLPTAYVKDATFVNMLQHNNGVEVFHVVYDTWRFYQELTYTDPLLGETTIEVGEEYKLNKANGDIKLVGKWEKEKYEVWKVLDFYLDAGPLKENRADLNNESVQKNPYNGIIARSIDGEVQSIVKEGLPFQRLINVVHFQTEKLINKNKDKVLIMPYGLLNKKGGMDTKSTMYHMDATSMLWIDETAPNAQFAAQMIKSVDMSMGNYIKESFEIIREIKAQYWESIGMNAQRYSDVGQNAGKAVTEQAIIRSAIITYELTRQFDKMIQKDYMGLLDISKLAYINGKKAKYVRTDGSRAYLNMNEDGAAYHSENSYAIMVKDSAELSEGIQAIRQQATNLVQNGGDTSVLGHLWSTNNVTKLTKILERLEEHKREYEQLVAKQQQDAQAALQDKINENDKANRDIETYKIDKQLEGIIYTADSRNANQEKGEEIKSDSPVTQQLAQHKIQHDDEKLKLERDRLAHDKVVARTKVNNK